ncbi:MAG: hypothetical protein LBP62_08350 [Clostridiales bacterium]|jgi:hypothetical protein|nr:hypothetical protein [Clostridiales bacterium]
MKFTVKNSEIKDLWKNVSWFGRTRSLMVFRFICILIAFLLTNAIFIAIVLSNGSSAGVLEYFNSVGKYIMIGSAAFYVLIAIFIAIRLSDYHVFAADGENVYFTDKRTVDNKQRKRPYNNTSWFEEGLYSIEKYSYSKNKSGEGVFVISFIEPSDAGGHGKIIGIKCKSLSDPGRLKSLLDSRGIPCVQDAKKRGRYVA